MLNESMVKFADGVEELLAGVSEGGEKKSDVKSMDELAVVEMRLSQVRNGDKKMKDSEVAKLHAKARKLQRKGRLERLAKEMERVRSGEDDFPIGIY